MYRFAICFALLTTGLLMGTASADESGNGKVYELRTYHVHEGRMPAMLKRFREHTTKLFEKHGISNIGYWQPEGDDADRTLIYLIAHESREAADRNWQAFMADAEWQKVREESEKDGKIVQRVERVWLTPTDFSKLK